MKKLIFFILLLLTPALASAEIEINEITNAEIVIGKTEITYEDGTDCKIIGINFPYFDTEMVEVICFQPAVIVEGGDTNTITTTTTTTEDNDIYSEDNDIYTSEENSYDNSNTRQNGATITINR